MPSVSCAFFLLLVAGLALCANPYHVETQSVVKEPYKWTMSLLNSHSSSVADNKEIISAAVTIESPDKNVLHVKIVDAKERRWEAPLLNPNSGKNFNKKPLQEMGFEYVNDPFSFKITDPATHQAMTDTSKVNALQFFDKYLELGLWYPSQRMFGMGERVTDDFTLCADRDNCKYTLWGKDVASPFDDGSGGCKGTYGQQPFYMIQYADTKQFFGVFLLNSNDQDVYLDKIAGGALHVTHKMIGGVFDFYFFYPGAADFVLQNYHELIGRPYLPPFWSLGFHQCRYGWRTIAKVKDVVAKFEQNDIPLEVVWADIDYMQGYADFTIDPVNFKGMKEFVQDLHKKKMRWVPIIDAGLKYKTDDKYYQLGEANNAFIKSAYTKKTLIGAVWPGSAVFISWYAPYAKSLWHLGLSDLYELAEFDGIWLDMNEIANFCRGECPPKSEQPAEERRLLGSDPHDPKEFDNLPYRPGNCDPVDKAVSLTGYHYSTNDYEDHVLKEYNLHSLWSAFEAKATHEFFVEKLKRRPFVLTRSNFPGDGLFTTKWLGDNHSRWEFLRYSVIGIYNYQLFGIPMVGADMCGFMGDTNEELCGRWMQLGAFYPFSRNHNDIHSRDQEPYVFGEKVAAASRNAIRQKYSILRYYYTKLFEVSLNGGSLIKPLFFEFPQDKGVYEKTKYMFMIGESILIPPVMHEGMTSTYPYCTNENWFNLVNFKQVYAYKAGKTEGGQITLPAGFDYVNVLLRGGSVIPFQDALKEKVRRTEVLKHIDMNIIVAPDHEGKAEGTLVVDDGVSLNTIENKNYRYLKFSFSTEKKRMDVKLLNDYNGETYSFESFAKLSILGAENWANIRSACISSKTGTESVRGVYDSSTKMLTFASASSRLIWKDITSVAFDATC